MKITINDENFGYEANELNNPRMRYGSRGIILNELGEIAVFNKQAKNEFKLPGGGIDEGEDPILAFKREAMEETGCEIKDIEFLGTIKEVQNKENFVQVSYVYKSVVAKNTNILNLTEKEKDEGAKLLWLKPEVALNYMIECLGNLKASNYDNVYRSKFMVTRDIEILKYYLNK